MSEIINVCLVETAEIEIIDLDYMASSPSTPNYASSSSEQSCSRSSTPIEYSQSPSLSPAITPSISPADSLLSTPPSSPQPHCSTSCKRARELYSPSSSPDMFRMRRSPGVIASDYTDRPCYLDFESSLILSHFSKNSLPIRPALKAKLIEYEFIPKSFKRETLKSNKVLNDIIWCILKRHIHIFGATSLNNVYCELNKLWVDQESNSVHFNRIYKRVKKLTYKKGHLAMMMNYGELMIKFTPEGTRKASDGNSSDSSANVFDSDNDYGTASELSLVYLSTEEEYEDGVEEKSEPKKFSAADSDF